MSWQECSLEELIDLHDHRRIPLSGVEREKRQGEFRYYGAQGVIDHIDAYIFDGEYVLVAEDGENLRSRKQPIAQIASGQFWVNNHAHILQAKGGFSNNAFICALLNWIDISPFVTGAAQPKLSQGSLKSIKVKVPDVGTQLQIAAVLSSYDDLIATNQRRIALLEDAARRLYREWFVHLRFPGHESVPVKDGVPEGWQLATFSDLVEINPRTSFPKEVARPFVEMSALSETSMIIGEPSMRVIGGGAKFKNGDTLFARITPCTENGKTGLVQFLEDHDAVASGSTEFIVLRSATVNPWWVYCMAREDNFREHAIRSMAGSDGRQRVNPKCFDQFATLQPPQLVLAQFEQAVKDSFTQVELLCKLNEQLAKARDLLLPKLMSGQIDVSGIRLPEEATA
jgi:type I restriction enzyme S subunit